VIGKEGKGNLYGILFSAYAQAVAGIKARKDEKMRGRERGNGGLSKSPGHFASRTARAERGEKKQKEGEREASMLGVSGFIRGVKKTEGRVGGKDEEFNHQLQVV